jgi:mRNA interferase MazF
LPVAGVILADQIKSLDWRARRAQCACSLPPEALAELLAKALALVAPE